MAVYLNNKDLLEELALSKKANALTPKAINMFIVMVQRSSAVFIYKNEMDREDCQQRALLDVCKYWKSFNHTTSKNAFSYFTQMTKNAAAKEWKRLHPIKNSRMVSLSNASGLFEV